MEREGKPRSEPDVQLLGSAVGILYCSSDMKYRLLNCRLRYCSRVKILGHFAGTPPAHQQVLCMAVDAPAGINDAASCHELSTAQRMLPVETLHAHSA